MIIIIGKENCKKSIKAKQIIEKQEIPYIYTTINNLPTISQKMLTDLHKSGMINWEFPIIIRNSEIFTGFTPEILDQLY